jgi:hypothetical protein
MKWYTKFEAVQRNFNKSLEVSEGHAVQPKKSKHSTWETERRGRGEGKRYGGRIGSHNIFGLHKKNREDQSSVHDSYSILFLCRSH